MQVTVQHTFPTAAAAAAFIASIATLPSSEGNVASSASTTKAADIPATTTTASTTTPAVPTKWFWNATTDTLFEIKKGDPKPAGFDGTATNITQHEYETHKLRLAEKFRAQQAASSSAASATSAATSTGAAATEFDPFADDSGTAGAVEVDEPTLVAKLQALAKHQPDGRTALMSILERAGVKGVPALMKGWDGAKRGALFTEVTKLMGG